MTDIAARVELSFESVGTPGVTWQVQSGSLAERLNESFVLQLNVATDDTSAEPVQMLGKSATFTVIRGAFVREVIGIAAEVREGSTHPEMVTAVVVVRPALEALRHRVNTKIFQEMTVPDILQAVLGEGLGAYGRSVDNRCKRSFKTCDYRVQYDESDLAFCRRLMEEEGIVSWFEFDGDAETLVLADDKGDYGSIESIHGSPITFTLHEGQVEGHEFISELHIHSQVRPTKLATRHFDWNSPSTFHEGETTAGPSGDAPSGAMIDPEREVYEQDDRPLTFEPGGTTYAGDKDDQVRLRREAQAFEARVGHGKSSVTAMRIGAIFEVSGHEVPGFDGKYLVLSVEHSFTASGGAYSNRFRCIPEDVPFRPLCRTPKPRISSVQTAIVVGPPGEEINTDEHGRIKVQFHWDRLGASDDHSSCWIRVMQPWAGSSWGFVFIPRIGMEVMVDFVDGDADRPLVIGSVYNGEMPVPYALPGEKTKSTIKTNSSLGGGGSNELRFEDKAGSEEVFTHAQKDQNEVVENDHTTTVHHDQKIRVDNDQNQEVGNNQTEHVFVNQDLTVDANRTVAVHGNFTETIDGSETRTVSSGVTETIDAGETRTVTGGMTETITGGRTQTITGGSTESISSSLSQSVTGGITITTPASYQITATGGFTLNAPGGITIIAPGGHSLVAPGGQTSIDESFFKVGSEYCDSFFHKGTIVLSKIDIVGSAFAHTTCHIETSLAKFCWASIKKANEPVTIKGLGNFLMQSYVAIHTLGLLVVT